MGSSDKAQQTSASNAKNPDAPDPTYLPPCPLSPFIHHFSMTDQSERLKGGGLNLEPGQPIGYSSNRNHPLGEAGMGAKRLKHLR